MAEPMSDYDKLLKAVHKVHGDHNMSPDEWVQHVREELMLLDILDPFGDTSTKARNAPRLARHLERPDEEEPMVFGPPGIGRASDGHFS